MVLVTTVWFLLFFPVQLMVYSMIIPLGINGCDQDNSKVEELMKLMLRFRGVLPGPIKDKLITLFILHYTEKMT